MIFAFENRRLFFEAQASDFQNPETLEKTGEKPKEASAETLSGELQSELGRFAQTFKDAWAREPESVSKYEPQALALVRRISGVVVRPYIDLADKGLEHVGTSVQGLLSGIEKEDEPEVEALLARLRDGRASKEDGLKLVGFVGMVAAGKVEKPLKVVSKVAEKIPGFSKFEREVGRVIGEGWESLGQMFERFSLLSPEQKKQVAKIAKEAGISDEEMKILQAEGKNAMEESFERIKRRGGNIAEVRLDEVMKSGKLEKDVEEIKAFSKMFTDVKDFGAREVKDNVLFFKTFFSKFGKSVESLVDTKKLADEVRGHSSILKEVPEFQAHVDNFDNQLVVALKNMGNIVDHMNKLGEKMRDPDRRLIIDVMRNAKDLLNK